jgi:hypothetical protein
VLDITDQLFKTKMQWVDQQNSAEQKALYKVYFKEDTQLYKTRSLIRIRHIQEKL